MRVGTIEPTFPRSATWVRRNPVRVLDLRDVLRTRFRLAQGVRNVLSVRFRTNPRRLLYLREELPAAYGAAATVNGAPVEIQANGNFQSDLALEVGLNTINVVVTDQSGRSNSRNAAVFVVPAADPLPFNVFYPWDGIEVRQRDLPVFGVTKPDAVVAVNGVLMEVNALGIFSGILALEDEANLVEILATDIDGNVRFETIVVFYTP